MMLFGDVLFEIVVLVMVVIGLFLVFFVLMWW